MDMIGDAPNGKRAHPILAGNSTQVSVQPVSYLIADARATVSGSKDNV
jgi:hypothetical protein